MIKYSDYISPIKALRRGRIQGFCFAAFLGLCAAPFLGNADTPKHIECDRQAIITDHYEAVLAEIHGFGFRPDLMPPPRKPQ